MKRNMSTVQSSVCVPRKRGTLAAIGCSTPHAMPTPAAVRVPPLGGTSFMKRNMSTVQWSVCVPRKRGTLAARGCSMPHAMQCPRPLEYRL